MFSLRSGHMAFVQMLKNVQWVCTTAIPMLRAQTCLIPIYVPVTVDFVEMEMKPVFKRKCVVISLGTCIFIAADEVLSLHFFSCYENCVHGYCSEVDNYTCICDLGWTGADCSVNCGCNNHSTCLAGVGLCDKCYNWTYGQHCEHCL